MNRLIVRRPHRQGGFTLVELLVVIVILGVLSAVVVFAVRGSGDKGKAAAVATDERILRTAMETYCAQTGHYPGAPPDTRTPMKALVEDRFLSAPSTYHDVALGGSQGNCAGLTYSITAHAPECGQFGGWCGPIAGFAAVPRDQMLSLPSGRVLALQSDRVQQFDPTVGTYGTWSLPMSPEASSPDRLVLLQKNPDPKGKDWCGLLCGKVMVHTVQGQWVLYDPTVSSSGAFLGPAGPFDPCITTLTPSGCPVIPGASEGPQKYYNGVLPTYAAQITGANCGARCGQVLIYYWTGASEFYDPATGSFSQGPEFNGPTKNRCTDYARSCLVIGDMEALPDGRVLLAGDPFGGAARLFVPGEQDRIQVVEPSKVSSLRQGVVLDNGDVLYIGREAKPEVVVNGQRQPNPPKAVLFDHTSNLWVPVPPCGNGGDCFALAKLKNGKVLAFGATYQLNESYANPAADDVFYSKRPRPHIYMFDPAVNPTVTSPWTETGSMKNPDTPNSAARISGENCAPNCDKVIAANQVYNGGSPRSSSELYTPP